MIHLLACFLAGGLGMLAMFIAVCLIPEIEEFLRRKK